MDNRDDHGKNHTSGNDGHGVHICHKCGWPFPNPHPSARHRRAHRKICGTIDGYKLVDARDSALSDDEHLSDEDHKTPGLEKRNDEITRAGSGDRSNRSEDEAFVDAVTEFSDSGSGKGIESSSDGVMKRARSIGISLTDNTKTALSFEDDPVTVVVPPSENSAYTSQDTESQGNTLSAEALDSENQPSHILVGSMGRPVTDYRAEESVHESVDVNSSDCDLNPIQLESQGNLSQEKLKKRAREDLTVLDVIGNQDYNKRHNTFDDSIDTDTKGQEKETKTFEAVPMSGETEGVASDHLAAAGVVESNNQRDDGSDSKKSLDVSSSEVGSISSTQINEPNTGEMSSEGLTEITTETGELNDKKEIKTFEAVPVSGKTEDVASDHVAAAGVVESNNHRDYGLDSKKSLDVPSEVGSISSTQINEPSTGVMSSECLTVITSETGELNDNFHVLSVPGDIPVLENAETLIEGYKDHRGGRMPQFLEVDSFEVINNFRDSVDKVSPSNSFSKLSDEGEKELFASGTDISKDGIPQEAGNSEHGMVNSSRSSLSDAGEQLFALETHVPSDSIEQEGGNRENVVEKPHNETEPGESQLKEPSQKHDESFVLHHAAANEVEKPDEQLNDNYHHSFSESISFEHDGATVPVPPSVNAEVREASELVSIDDTAPVPPSVNAEVREASELVSKDDTAPVPPSVNAEVREASELVSKDDADDFEIRSVITNSKEAKAVAEDSSFGKMTAAPEDLGIRSKGVVPESNDFSEDKYVSDTGNGKAAGSYGSEIEIRSGDLSLGPVDECNLVNTAGRPEIAEDLHETLVSSKDVTSSDINMSEPKLVLLNDASDSQEHGTGDKGEKPEGDTTTIAEEKEGLLKSSSNARDVPMLKEPSGKIDDFEASQESGEKQRTKESQLSPSNVLPSIQNSSTIGDDAARNPAGAGPEYGTGEGENILVAQQLGASATDVSVDSGSQTDSLEGHWGSVSVLSAQSDKPAAVDLEKADAKTPKAATEETEKADMVEPPSFMTLVEPRDGENKAAEIQTAQNPKAGWFPSIGNVVNESQGRKKNEEMIAKVTNWSTAKQHAPLKNLLSETETETENKRKQDEPKPAAASNEWNSPARYPADIKREKRRPYWAQFMCCTSAN